MEAGMFRVNDPSLDQKHSLTGRAIETVLVVALLANLASTYLIVDEYSLQVRSLSADFLPRDTQALHTLMVLQLVSAGIVTTSLILGLVATWWLRRRYFSSQRSLRQVKMLAHDILAGMDRGVVTTDRGGTVTSINSAALRLLRVDHECVGRSLMEMESPAFPVAEVFRDVTDHQQPVRDRDVIVARDGRNVRVRLEGSVLNDTQGTPIGCVIYLEDTTERMLLEDRMRRMERFLGLSALASGLHHEIKNPLTALSIHVQLLEERLLEPDGAGAIGELVEILKTEVCRLNGVLENFRSFANMQRLSLRPTDALGIIEDVIRLIRPQAAAQRVRIAFVHPEKEMPPVYLDPDKFERIVLNLVINALEAMPAGGSLTVSAAADDGECHVTVKDSGPGIPPEVQSNLFQPYFSTKDKGTGMGLALSEKLAAQHGGRIDFRTGSEGTSFRIVIPLVPRNGDQ